GRWCEAGAGRRDEGGGASGERGGGRALRTWEACLTAQLALPGLGRSQKRTPSRAPDGAVLSLSGGDRASLAGPGREKSKACRGCREKTERGCISGHSGCSVCGRKEKEKGKTRKTNG
ncbi:unnamed protein product, partial [Gulo gulo]